MSEDIRRKGDGSPSLAAQTEPRDVPEGTPTADPKQSNYEDQHARSRDAAADAPQPDNEPRRREYPPGATPQTNRAQTEHSEHGSFFKNAAPPSQPLINLIKQEQMEDALLMIDHAARSGQDIPQEVLAPILKTKMALQHGILDENSLSTFIGALTKLSRLIAPATVESIKFSSSKDPKQQQRARRIAKRYNWLGIAVFVVLIFLQGYWFVLNSFVQDVKSVQEQLKPYSIVADFSWKEVNEDQQKQYTDAATKQPRNLFDGA
jgi:hypothetical protein